MQKIRKAVLGIIVICSAIFLIIKTVYAQDTGNGKNLYIIYDNSLSMKGETNAWEKAAYAIETIVAMMDEQDSVTIYFMKDEEDFYIKNKYTQNEQVKELESIFVESPGKSQDELLQATGSTYINGLEQAILDIYSAENQEAQLLLLSDGDFNRRGKEDISGSMIDLEEKLPGIRTIYFRMGVAENDKVTGVTESFEATEDDILSTFAEITNKIYDRQSIELIRDEEGGTFNLELPAKRLIILSQSNENQVSGQGVMINSRKMEEVFNESFESPENEKDGYSRYYGNVKIYKSNNLIPRGEYSITIPENVEVEIYVEYEVEYSVRIINEQGEEWELKEGVDTNLDGAFREGMYTLEVKLKDVSNDTIIEEAAIYDKLELELELGEYTIEEIETELYLSEGSHTIMGTLNLEGNYPQDINVEFEIKHQLGELGFHIELPERGLDIDALGEGENKIFVSLLENGSTIEDCNNLTLEILDSSDVAYQYEIKEVERGWEIYPSMPELEEESSLIGDKNLKLRIAGEKEGQEFQETLECPITYYALPKEITFRNTSKEFQDIIWFLMQREMRVEPLIDGELIDTKNGIEEITPVLSDFSGIEGMTVNLEYSDEGPLQLVLKFNGIIGFWKLLKGGELSGELDLTLVRYGESCHGKGMFSIQIGKIGRGSIITILVLVLLLLYIIIVHILLKGIILKSRFWFIPVSVQCKVRYGERVRIIEIPVARQRFLNFFRLMYPRITISLKEIDYLKISAGIPEKIILRNARNGQGAVVNIDKFVSCGSVYKDGRQLTNLDVYFDWEDGLNWVLSGKRKVEIKVALKRRY